MKLEHVKVGRDYMWGDRRVTVRCIGDAMRDGDPDTDSDTEVDFVTIIGQNDGGEPEWQHVPVSALHPLSARLCAVDIRANYAHRFVPDALEPIKPNSRDSRGRWWRKRPETVVYRQWEDVPAGAVVQAADGDIAQADAYHNRRWPRVAGEWGLENVWLTPLDGLRCAPFRLLGMLSVGASIDEIRAMVGDRA